MSLNLVGTDGEDVLIGGPGDDTIDGRGGADRMEGGAGNDIYYVDNINDLVIEAVGGGYDRVLSSVSYLLTSGSEIEILSTRDISGTAAIALTGNEFGQYLFGNAGDNSLDGGGGADVLAGYGGNDWYYVDNSSDLVIEAAGDGYDRVLSSASYILASGSEIEILSARDTASTAAIALTGNEFGQYLFGNAGDNSLDGGAGADVLVGYGGNDWYYVDSSSDLVIEAGGQGYDRVLSSVSYILAAGSEIEILSARDTTGTAAIALTGNEFGQYLLGNAGDNSLDGGGGADVLVGYGGNDWYYVDSNDLVIEAAGGGYDRVLSSASYILTTGSEIEILSARDTTGTAAIALTGNEFGQYLFGNAGDNSLDGGGGADVLVGYGGNDWYYVDNSSDLAIEAAGGGYDRVLSSTNYILSAGSEIEILSTRDISGTAAIALTGNEFGQYLFGNAGDNSLDGGGGADVLAGYGGNDWYYVDNSSDLVIEAAGDGYDRVLSSASYILASGSEIEILSARDTASTAAIALTGNEFGQYLFGNAGDNSLDGGAGADVLVGGAGHDNFAFTTGFGPGTGNIDTITDFQVGIDKISLGGAVGQPFFLLATGALGVGAFRIGTVAIDADDRIIYNNATGALLYDADGAGGNAALQFATLGTGLNLSAADFVVTGLPNSLPTISSGSTATVQENIATTAVVYQAVANDADGDTFNFSLSGTDANRFTIDQTGAVRFIASPDYETKNSYSFTVNVYDSSGQITSRTVALNVTDVNETPTGGSPYVVTDTGSNDSIGTAQALDRNQFTVVNNSNLPDPSLPSAQINGSISPDTDQDFFSITLKAGELLILDVDGTNSLDSYLRVFGPNGAELVTNDDQVSYDPGSTTPGFAHNVDSLIRFRAPNDGTYTFSIASYEDAGVPTSSGTYTINVSLGPVATPAQINEENIQALLGGSQWPAGTVTYGFTTDPSQYGPNEGVDERANAFEALNSTQRTAVRQVLTQMSGVMNLSFSELTANPGGAQMRYAMSDEPDTAYAFYPGAGNGGDSWYHNSPTTRDDGSIRPPPYDNPVVGNYAYMTFLHETGHALGLKHGHESPALSYDRDSIEFSVMTYRGYIGAPVDEVNGGYRNETWGYAQTLMMYDIAALQRLYGANFNTQSGNSVYSWNSGTGAFMINGATQWTPGGNRVFMTVWDGGGNDTYDLSNYSTGVTIDLRPGEWTITSQVQLANLGLGHIARGNVANSLLYNNDTRSLIENAIGGSGNDTLIANQAANQLTGGQGSDTFRFASNSDVGMGALQDRVADFLSGTDHIDLSGIDANTNISGDQGFSFVGSGAFTGVAGQLRFDPSQGSTTLFGDTNGDGIADFSIFLQNTPTITSNDFIL